MKKTYPGMELTRDRWDDCGGSGYNGCRGGDGCGNLGISLGIGGIGIIQWGSIISKWGDSPTIITRDSIMVRCHDGLGFLRKTNCQNGGENELKGVKKKHEVQLENRKSQN